MGELLTHTDLVMREQRARFEKLEADPTAPRVPGFGSLSKLEEEHQRIERELEQSRKSFADQQRHLENSILRLEVLKENVIAGDQLCERFKGMIEHGIDEAIEGRISKSPDSEVHILRTLNEVPARQLFIERWPSVKKSIQSKIKKLDAEIRKMMSESEKGDSNE